MAFMGSVKIFNSSYATTVPPISAVAIVNARTHMMALCFFPPLNIRAAGPDSLIYVKEDLIIPQVLGVVKDSHAP